MKARPQGSAFLALPFAPGGPARAGGTKGFNALARGEFAAARPFARACVKIGAGTWARREDRLAIYVVCEEAGAVTSCLSRSPRPCDRPLGGRRWSARRGLAHACSCEERVSVCRRRSCLPDPSFLHVDRMQSRRFVNGRVLQAHVPGQVDVGQLALKPGSRRNAFAEAVLLVEIHEVENVFRNRLRVGCIESHYQLDGNVLPVERVGDINVALAPSEWPMTTTMS